MESDSIILFLSVLIVSILALAGLADWVVVRIVYQTTGFERMAGRFRAAAEPEGLRFGDQTISVGAMRFRHCAMVIVGPSGFYLKAWAILPPLLIPWPDLHAPRNTVVRQRPVVELSVGSPVAGRISVFPELFAALEPYLTPAHQ
ncbi:MAG: hypothetical protein NTY38_23675 [Acidobacteria bacterium]|nr:hypothetical protein [Acidobacteriota bacterium]